MNHSVLAKPPLFNHEQDHAYDECDESANDSTAVPSLRNTTPLKSKNEAGNGANDEDKTKHIELAKHATPVGTRFGWFIREEEEDEKA
jgi:hypothetical protein